MNIPILNVDKLNGKTIELSSANNEMEIVKIRIPNLATSAKSESASFDSFRNQSIKTENDDSLRKVTGNYYTLNGTNQTFSNGISSNGDVKPQIYENDLKISFVSYKIAIFVDIFIFNSAHSVSD